MPRVGFYGGGLLGGGADPLGLRPRLTRAPTDDLETQLKLAQIANLRSEGQDRTAARALQALSLKQENQTRQDAQFETSTHNVEEEKHWARLLGVDEAKLKENARQHDTSLAELSDFHKEELKTQLTSSLAGDLIARGGEDYPPDVIMSMLSKRGVPELLAAKQEITGQKQAEKAKKEAEQQAIEAAALGGKTAGPAAAATETPGYVPGLAGTVGDALKYLPIDTANLGGGIYNKTILPVNNLLGSLIGTPPARKAKPIPRDYSTLFQ